MTIPKRDVVPIDLTDSPHAVKFDEVFTKSDVIGAIIQLSVGQSVISQVSCVVSPFVSIQTEDMIRVSINVRK